MNTHRQLSKLLCLLELRILLLKLLLVSLKLLIIMLKLLLLLLKLLMCSVSASVVQASLKPHLCDLRRQSRQSGLVSTLRYHSGQSPNSNARCMPPGGPTWPIEVGPHFAGAPA